MNLRTTAATLLLLATSTAAAGCSASRDATATAPTSSASLSANASQPTAIELITLMRSNAPKATSVQIAGVQNLANGSKDPMSLRGRLDGSNMYDRSVDDETKQTVEYIVVNKTVYIRSTAAYWAPSQGSRAAKGMANTWVATRSADSDKTWSVGTVLGNVLKDPMIDTLSASTSTVTKGSTAGQPSYTIELDAGSRSRLVVSADGKALPLRVVSTLGDITFSQWNAVKPMPKPSPVYN